MTEAGNRQSFLRLPPPQNSEVRLDLGPDAGSGGTGGVGLVCDPKEGRGRS